MGFKSIIVLMMCVSLVLVMTSSFNSSPNPLDKIDSAARGVKITQANLTVGFGSITFGTLNFPDVFGIFGGLADLLGSISGLISEVLQPLNSLPAPLLAFLSALLLILFAVSVIGWWKGNEAG